MKKDNSSKKDRLALRGILLIVSLIILLFSFDVFCVSANLFVIGDNIKFMEETGKWTDDDLDYYDELIEARQEVKENSLTGFLLVSAGANLFTQIVRIFLIFGLFLLDLALFLLWGSLIKSDFLRHLRRFRKKAASKAIR